MKAIIVRETAIKTPLNINSALERLDDFALILLIAPIDLIANTKEVLMYVKESVNELRKINK